MNPSLEFKWIKMDAFFRERKLKPSDRSERRIRIKTSANASALAYSPKAYNPAYGLLLKQTNGLQIMNMFWISRDFDARGMTDMRDTHLVKAVVQTLNHSAATCEHRNPHLYDPAGNVSALLLYPPELFVAWLNHLSSELLHKLPLYQYLGAEWVTTVNRRLPLCNAHFDAVTDVSLARAALAKLLR